MAFRGQGGAQASMTRLYIVPDLRADPSAPNETIEPSTIDSAVGETSAEPADGARARAPENCRIRWTDTPGSSSIVLPALGFTSGTLFLLLAGISCSFVGLAPIVIVTSRPTLGFHGATSPAWIIGCAFLLLGLLMAVGSIIGSCAREVVREDEHFLEFHLTLLKIRYRVRRMPKTTIEEISVQSSRRGQGRVQLRATTSRAREARGARETEILVRSRTTAVRLGDGLEPSDQRWLRDALAGLAGRRA
jgi:hypothetical protein